MKHSKLKGTIAVAKAIAKFNQLGINVFTEFGDLSKIDLLIEYNGIIKRIQVKSVDVINGKIVLPVRKTGPNGYVYTYKHTDFDYFVIYIPSLDKLLVVPSNILNAGVNTCSNSYVIRVNPSKNNQKKGVHLIKDHESFDIILRDFTPDPLREDKVQTTTKG